MRVRAIVLGMALALLPSLVMAQAPPQNREQILGQLLDDVFRSRQNAEIEAASCKVQVKDLQQQLQAATTPKTEPTKDKK